VMLKVSPWKGVVRSGKWGKLNPRDAGPFKTLARVEALAYKLSYLENGLHIGAKLQIVEEPVEIMDREVKRLKQSRFPIVKVRRNSRRGPEFIWEREDQFQKKYPHLFTNRASSSNATSLSLEDKAHLTGGDNNTPCFRDKVETDYELAQRLQAEEQEELTIKKKSKLFQQLLEKRRKHFAAKRAEERRSKPPTKAQQRSIMTTYLKNMAGWKPKDLKNKSFASKAVRQEKKKAVLKEVDKLEQCAYTKKKKRRLIKKEMFFNNPLSLVKKKDVCI
ncbi:hypothetical protein Tco_1458726, partial [Tanacetum coccineum]